jgi:hypothetical protein
MEGKTIHTPYSGDGKISEGIHKDDRQNRADLDHFRRR